MKTPSLILGAALGIALVLTGCESDNASARMQEKSAAAAALKPWQRKYIERGDIANGFTSDMVYMAIGRASNVTRSDVAGGGNAEVWTYINFYVPHDAVHYRPTTQGAKPYDASASTPAVSGQSQTTGGNAGKSARTTGLQGGSGEPADVQAYTLIVSFKDGKVVKFALTAN